MCSTKPPIPYHPWSSPLRTHAGKAAIISAGFVLACLAEACPLRAQTPADRPVAIRLAIDTRTFCRAKPHPASAPLQRIPLFANISVTRQHLVARGSWYFDSSRVSVRSPACWVYGPDSIEYDQPNPQAACLATLDHILARRQVRFEEYVDVENALSRCTPATGLVQFRRLQMIERALMADDASVQAVKREPLKAAWLAGHEDLLYFFEPSGHWWLRKERYLEMWERHKDAPWAEELAWALATPRPADECYSACLLAGIVQGPLQYWIRFPAGPHTDDALRAAAKTAQYAAALACYDRNATTPGTATSSPVPPATVSAIRDSLAQIVLPEKQEILHSLEEAERKCRQ